MLKTESVTIDEIEFSTTQFPAMHAFAVLADLIKVAGPALSLLASQNGATELSDLGPQLGAALSTLRPEDATSLLKKLFGSSQAIISDGSGGRRVVQMNSDANINIVFTGKLKALFQCAGHAIKTNYGDFTAGIDQSASSIPPVSAV